jgi:hypothetical protein
MANANNGINLNNLVSNTPGKQTIKYGKVAKALEPYVYSRVWQRIINKRFKGLPINNSNYKPSRAMIYLALATALGVRYTTTGRGGSLEDAPFLPKVAAIPVIPRSLWSTNVPNLPVKDIEQIMRGTGPNSNFWGGFGRSNGNTVKNYPSTIRESPLTRGAISNFYKPAFMQMCDHDGEWLVNGFKVDKDRIMTVVQQATGMTKNQVESLIGKGSKGTTAAESDILKITILNYGKPNAHIIFTVGEDKVGQGESSQAKGKEIAQIRFSMWAIYYMFIWLHKQDPRFAPHPWQNIRKITVEAVFLAAGAKTVNQAKLTNQIGLPTRIQSPNGSATAINVSVVDLDKFCGIFRLDKSRFGAAMTSVDGAFLDAMKSYIRSIEGTNGALPVNSNSNIPVPVALSARQNYNKKTGTFNPALLYGPRTAWGENANRIAYEMNWLSRLKTTYARNGRKANENRVNTALGKFSGSVPARVSTTGGYSRGVGTGVGAFSTVVPQQKLKNIVNAIVENAERYGQGHQFTETVGRLLNISASQKLSLNQIKSALNKYVGPKGAPGFNKKQGAVLTVLPTKLNMESINALFGGPNKNPIRRAGRVSTVAKR